MPLRKFEEITNKVKYNDYLMPFGRYHGEFLVDIKKKDPKYLTWLYEQIDNDKAWVDLRKAVEFHTKEFQKKGDK